jgi:hypothetical protein
LPRAAPKPESDHNQGEKKKAKNGGEAHNICAIESKRIQNCGREICAAVEREGAGVLLVICLGLSFFAGFAMHNLVAWRKNVD